MVFPRPRRWRVAGRFVVGGLPQFVQGPCPIADLRRYARARGLSVGGLMGRPRRARSTVGKTLCVRVGCSGIRCTEVTGGLTHLPQEHRSVFTFHNISVRSQRGSDRLWARGGHQATYTTLTRTRTHTRVTCVDSRDHASWFIFMHHLASWYIVIDRWIISLQAPTTNVYTHLNLSIFVPRTVSRVGDAQISNSTNRPSHYPNPQVCVLSDTCVACETERRQACAVRAQGCAPG